MKRQLLHARLATGSKLRLHRKKRKDSEMFTKQHSINVPIRQACRSVQGMVLGPCPCRGFWRESPTYVGDGQDTWPGYMCLLAKKRKGLKSFLAESRGQKLKLSLLPLRQKSQRVENQNFGGNFSRRICLLGPKIHSSAKTGSLSIFRRFFLRKFSSKILAKIFFFGVEK